MAMVTINDPQFSMGENEKYSARRSTRRSPAKNFERQIVHAWKIVTGATRKHHRASFMPRDFVLVNSRRRSAILPQAFRV
ncbi:hypothetical protein BDZ94DRAFT_1197674 [Collybia nuda]|uniref:Uncharacterized protein n=1 Tax=Collybia nuda TaxID=64659 RepID=A0A9P5Y1E3_9AGAR|nr:hypothetical protein BDZ94DRAFT_1197674 [Collybia nuda]